MSLVIGRFRCGCENHWNSDTRIYEQRIYCAQHKPSLRRRFVRWITRQGVDPARSM